MDKSLKSGIIITLAICASVAAGTKAKSLDIKLNDITKPFVKTYNRIKNGPSRPPSVYKYENVNPETDNIKDFVIRYQNGTLDTLYGYINSEGKLDHTRNKPQ